MNVPPEVPMLTLASAPPPTESSAVRPDDDLIQRFRAGDVGAVGLFVARYRPLLEAYARKVRIPRADWPVCIAELLEDEVIRLSSPDVPIPLNIGAYLVRSAYHRYMRIVQTVSGRQRMHEVASEEYFGVHVVASAHSQGSLRLSAGPDAPADSMSIALRRLADELGASLTKEESVIMVWVSEGVPHRQIAKWLDISYDACTKRIWRLCGRLRGEAAKRLAHYSLTERTEIERFMRRAGDAAPAANRRPSGKGAATTRAGSAVPQTPHDVPRPREHARRPTLATGT